MRPHRICRRARRLRARAQAGATAVEVAFSLSIFFTMLFFTMELARALYMINTLQEATRRAASGAAVTDFSDAAAMAGLRQAAVLRDQAGTLPLGAPVTDAYIRIDYLSLARGSDGTLALTPIPAASLPACPARTRIACASNPYGASCIRFVRARVCAPDGGDCAAVAYQPLLAMSGLGFTLPESTTIARAESLGFQAGSPVCP